MTVERDVSPATEAGRNFIDPAQQPDWLREGITYALDPDAFTRTILDIEQQAAALERRKTVERIRDGLPGYTGDLNGEEKTGYAFALRHFCAILDALASESEPQR